MEKFQQKRKELSTQQCVFKVVITINQKVTSCKEEI